jgi:hypothetical protein
MERECTSQTSGDEERLTIYRYCTAKNLKPVRENQMLVVIVGGVAAGDSDHSCCACTDLNCLCYNSFHGAGTAALGWCLPVAHFGRRFSLVSMVSINLGIWFYEVETGDTGESIEPEESH